MIKVQIEVRKNQACILSWNMDAF